MPCRYGNEEARSIDRAKLSEREAGDERAGRDRRRCDLDPNLDQFGYDRTIGEPRTNELRNGTTETIVGNDNRLTYQR